MLTHACVCVCMHAHTRVYTLAFGFLLPFFSKNSLFVPKVSYIFYKHFPQINFLLIGP